MNATSPDELVTLVDGTVKTRSAVTAEEEKELAHWRVVREERTKLAAQRKKDGEPPLCSFYDRPRGEFCTVEGTNIRKSGDAGMATLPFCDRHLKAWYT